MKRSRLRNKYFKNNDKESRKLYTKQRNYFVLLLRETKKVYYEILDGRKLSVFLENSKAYTIPKIQCQRKDKFK